MAGAHEQVEHAEEAEHLAGSNRKIALLISVLALFLAFAETLGKSAQTEGLRANIEAANLWAFYQAKHMRETILRTSAETMELDLATTSDPDVKAAKQKRIAGWQKTADRYQSDPEKHEGRKELEEQAREKEKERDRCPARAAFHLIARAGPGGGSAGGEVNSSGRRMCRRMRATRRKKRPARCGLDSQIKRRIFRVMGSTIPCAQSRSAIRDS